MDVKAHTMRGIDPLCKLVEEEYELNLLPQWLPLPFELSGLFDVMN